MSRFNRLVDTRPLCSSRAFRRLWIGGSISSFGAELTVVAVLTQIWDLTGSSVAVGSIGLAEACPMVVFGLIGGSLADIADRRRLVFYTTAGQLIAAILLAAQAFSHVGSVQLVLGLVCVKSACRGLGAPAKRTLVPRLLPAEHIVAGVALTHLSFQLAMLTGPAVAGVIATQWGVGTCYGVDAIAFGIGLVCVSGLPSMRPTGAPNVRGFGAFWDGWRFIGSSLVIRGVFLIDMVATVLAMPIALFPAINHDRFGGDPEQLGVFLSAIAVGGIVAGFASGMIAKVRRQGRVMLAGAGAWAVGIVGFGMSPSLWLALGLLCLAGAGDTIAVISRGSIVQLATPDDRRGRVSAVEHIIGASGPDIGNFRAGLVAGATSASVSVIAGGLLCSLCIVVVAATNRVLRQFGISDDAALISNDLAADSAR